MRDHRLNHQVQLSVEHNQPLSAPDILTNGSARPVRRNLATVKCL